MNKYIKKGKKIVIEHKIISGVILMVVLFIGYKIFSSGNNNEETFVVKRGDVVQKVIVNGKTKPVHAVNLGFESTGKVSAVYAGIGTRVTVGQHLVSLDSSETYANLLKAKASLASEQAKLDELKKGTRPEEIAVAETEVANAETTLSDAKKNLQDKVVDIITNNVDQLFSNPHTANPQFNLTVIDSQLKNDINFQRSQIEYLIKNWTVDTGDTNIPAISAFIDNVAIAVNSQSATPSLTQSTIDGYKSSISTSRSTLITAKESLNNAKSSLTLANKNLILKKSGNTPEAIKAEVAQVSQGEAEVQSIEAALSKMTIRSPQNGVVTVQDAKVGEIVTPGKTLVSIISDSDLEIESNVSEISIGKVAVGNPVAITFDAFPGEVFDGAVTYIEPGETVVDGVVNYKVTVAFSKIYLEVKSGLTSKLEIITAVKKDVVIVPQYALQTLSDGIFVLEKEGKKFSKVPVSVGIRGQDGSVEIISGVSPGDIIDMVVPTK